LTPSLINLCGMNRDRQDSERDHHLADHRISILLGLAFCLVLINVFSMFSFKWTANNEPAVSLTINSTGLAIASETIDYQNVTRSMVVNFTPFFFQPVPVNHASVEMLTTIPGVGQVLAEAIINRRQKSGLFSRPQDLINVHGIGQKRMVWLAKHLSFEQ